MTGHAIYTYLCMRVCVGVCVCVCVGVLLEPLLSGACKSNREGYSNANGNDCHTQKYLHHSSYLYTIHIHNKFIYTYIYINIYIFIYTAECFHMDIYINNMKNARHLYIGNLHIQLLMFYVPIIIVLAICVGHLYLGHVVM